MQGNYRLVPRFHAVSTSGFCSQILRTGKPSLSYRQESHAETNTRKVDWKWADKTHIPIRGSWMTRLKGRGNEHPLTWTNPVMEQEKKCTLVWTWLKIHTVQWETFERENVHKFWGIVVIRDSFLCEIWGVALFGSISEQSAKVFCVKILFSTNLWKFSPTNVSCYTVVIITVVNMYLNISALSRVPKLISRL